MKTIKIDQNNLTDQNIEAIAGYLKQGKVMVYPTDTVYGLGCLATDEKAVRRIFKIKERPPDLALLVLVKSYCMLHDYCRVSRKQDRYIRSVWPPTTRAAHNPAYKHNRPATTFILQSKGKLPAVVSGGEDSLAVRLPKNDFLIKILKKANMPIISTSCNKHGQKPPPNLQLLENYFTIRPDIVIDAGAFPGQGKPSRIIDIRNIDNIKKIR